MFTLRLLWVLLCGLLGVGACHARDLLTLTPEQYIAFVGDDISKDFFCINNHQSTVQSFLWLINGVEYRSPFNQTDPVPDCANGSWIISSAFLPQVKAASLDLYATPTSCNETRIQCKGILQNGTVVKSPEGKLVLQGRVGSPSNLQGRLAQTARFFTHFSDIDQPEEADSVSSAQTARFFTHFSDIDQPEEADSVSSEIVLQWAAPFSLDVTGYPNNGISYRVDIIRPDGRIESMNTTATTAEVTFDQDESTCRNFTFRVSASNIVGSSGEHESASREYPPPYCSSVQLSVQESRSDQWQLEWPAGLMAKLLIIEIQTGQGAQRLWSGTTLNKNSNHSAFPGEGLEQGTALNLTLDYQYLYSPDDCQTSDHVTAECSFIVRIPIQASTTTMATTHQPTTLTTPQELTTMAPPLQPTTLTPNSTEEGHSSIGGYIAAGILVPPIILAPLGAAGYVVHQYRKTPAYYRPGLLLNILSCGIVYCLQAVLKDKARKSLLIELR